jgi:hypothetical protein
MFSKKDRVLSLLTAAEKEMSLLAEMSKYISRPDDFLDSMSGMVLFRAFLGMLSSGCAISCPTNMAMWTQRASSIR